MSLLARVNFVLHHFSLRWKLNYNNRTTSDVVKERKRILAFVKLRTEYKITLRRKQKKM